MAISSNGTVLARVAGGLYNTTMSNATYAETIATIKTTADLNAWANDVYSRDFSGQKDLTVAQTLLKNLDISVTGLDNWVAAQLTAATNGKGAKVVELLNGLANLTADETYGSYATSFNAKVDASLALSQTAGSIGGDFAAGQASTASASTTLTADVDEVAGTGANDTIKGVMDFSGNASTFTASDLIDGGAGDNTLNVTLVGHDALADAVTAGVVLNVQTINITNAASSAIAADLDLSGVTGAKSVNLASSPDNTTLTLSSVNNVVDASIAGKGGLTLGYITSAVLGLNDTQNLTLNGTSKGTNATNKFTADGIENLKISAVKTSDVVISGDAYKTVELSGSAAAKVTVLQGAGARTITSIDASTATGDLVLVDATAAAYGNGLSVKTGAGNDTIALLGNAIDKSVKVDGGAGNDTLAIVNDAIATTDLSGVTNVENITLSGTGAATSISMSLAKGLTNINTSLQTTGLNKAGTFTASNVASGAVISLSSANLSANNATDPALFDLDGQDAVTISVKNATSAANTTDALTFNVVNNNTSLIKNTSSLSTMASKNVYVIDSVTAAGVETVTVNSTGTFGSNSIVDLVVTSATSLVLTGSTALSLGTSTSKTSTDTLLSTSSTDTVTFDASAMTGKLSVVMTGGEAAHYDAAIKGGQNTGDSVTVLVGSGQDVALKSVGFEKASVVFDEDSVASFDFAGLVGATTAAKFTTSNAPTVETAAITGLGNGGNLVLNGTLGVDAFSVEGGGNTSSLTLTFNQEEKTGTANSGDFIAGGLTVTRVGNLTIDVTRVDGSSDADTTATQAPTTLGGLTNTVMKTLTVTGPDSAANVLSIGQLSNGSASGSVLSTIDLSNFLGDIKESGLALDVDAKKGVTVILSEVTNVGTYDHAITINNVAGLTLGSASSDVVKFAADLGGVVIGGFQAATSNGAAVALGTPVDKLDLSASGAKLSQLTFTDIDVDNDLLNDLESVEITFSTSSGITGALVLVGVVTADLSAANFVFAS